MSELNSCNKNIFFHFRIMLKALQHNHFEEELTKSATFCFKSFSALLRFQGG